MTTAIDSPFRAHTGLMGATEPNQPVTIDNAHFLPPGSVVRLADDAVLVHLHNDLWYCAPAARGATTDWIAFIAIYRECFVIIPKGESN